MKYEDIDRKLFSFREEYTDTCTNCGMVHTVITQEDDNAEYMTSIYIVCICKELVHFSLPVN